jgi:hypothetical protein
VLVRRATNAPPLEFDVPLKHLNRRFVHADIGEPTDGGKAVKFFL